MYSREIGKLMNNFRQIVLMFSEIYLKLFLSFIWNSSSLNSFKVWLFWRGMLPLCYFELSVLKTHPIKYRTRCIKYVPAKMICCITTNAYVSAITELQRLPKDLKTINFSMFRYYTMYGFKSYIKDWGYVRPDFCFFSAVSCTLYIVAFLIRVNMVE